MSGETINKSGSQPLPHRVPALSGILKLLRLFRAPNLTLIALTDYLIYYGLINPYFHRNGIRGSWDPHLFPLFVCVTLYITAAAYLVNDILDASTDAVNRPEKLLMKNKTRRRFGWWLYWSMTVAAGLLSLYIAWEREQLSYWLLYPLSVALLFGYNTLWKGTPLWGNLLVALFCGGVPALFFLTEWEPLILLEGVNPPDAKQLASILTAYALFAFLSNLYREQVKDLQDEMGDRATGKNTAAVTWGQKTARSIAQCTCLFLAIGIMSMVVWYIPLDNIFLPHIFLIQLPLGYSGVMLHRAQNPKDFRKVGLWIKFIMLAGLLLLTYMIYLVHGTS